MRKRLIICRRRLISAGISDHSAGVLTGAAMRHVICCLFLSAVLSWPVGVSAAWHELSADKMGTQVRLEFWLEDQAAAQILKSAALREFDRLESLLSPYIETSELAQVNLKAAAEPVRVSEEFYALLDVAQQVAELTNGAFDVSYASVGYLYDFRERRRPDAVDIAAGLDAVDYRQIILDEDALTVTFGKPGMRIDLGGIAKGFAVEQVTRLLQDGGVEHALVSAGGDMRLLGDRRGESWLIGIRDPDNSEGLFTRLALEDEAVSTSGDYERFFIEDGQRFHHILNPVSGEPVAGVRSVTIVGPDGTLTDSFSTSVFVLGAEAGMEFIAEMDGFEALIILADGTWYYSGGLQPESANADITPSAQKPANP